MYQKCSLYRRTSEYSGLVKLCLVKYLHQKYFLHNIVPCLNYIVRSALVYPALAFRGVFPCRVGWGVEPPYPEICRTFDPSFCRSFVRGLARHTSYRRLAQGTWAGGLADVCYSFLNINRFNPHSYRQMAALLVNNTTSEVEIKLNVILSPPL